MVEGVAGCTEESVVNASSNRVLLRLVGNCMCVVNGLTVVQVG